MNERPPRTATPKMHPDEVDVDAALARRLVAAQFPEWSGLPLDRVPSSGTDNALFRLGDELVVRLPRIEWAVGGIEKEFRWLPRLGPLLPVAVPQPIAKGTPAEGYPWEWGVYSWLEGENPAPSPPPDVDGLADDAARFVQALHAIDPTGGPPARRGAPVQVQDERARAAHGCLSGVIDWAGVGVGDPACDLIVAWGLLPPEARAPFREQLSVDDATWERGRGWALSLALIAIPYYRETNPAFAATAGRLLDEVLAEEPRLGRRAGSS